MPCTAHGILKEGDTKSEGERQEDSPDPTPVEGASRQNRPGIRVHRRRATAAIGTVQQRPDEAARQGTEKIGLSNNNPAE